MQQPMQVAEKAPSLVKEGLLMALGSVLAFVGIILSFISLILGDLIFVGGLVLAIVFMVKHYKKKAFMSQHALSKFAIIKNSITLSLFLIILTIAMLAINFFKILF